MYFLIDNIYDNSSKIKDINKYSSLTPSLNKKKIRQIRRISSECNFIPKISNIISKLDNIIEKENILLDSYNDYKKGLLQKLFI